MAIRSRGRGSVVVPADFLHIGSREAIQLRRTTPENMDAAGRLSGLLIQALRELGQEDMTHQRRDHLKRTLPANERRELIKDLRLVAMHLAICDEERHDLIGRSARPPSLPIGT